ncbi:hypothetical protein ACWELO_35445 [Streptomyces sp. NPDC004596]
MCPSRTCAGTDPRIAVVLNVHRVRRHNAPTDPRYAELEARLLKQPPITVPP